MFVGLNLLGEYAKKKDLNKLGQLSYKQLTNKRVLLTFGLFNFYLFTKYLNINNRHIFDSLFFRYTSLKNVSIATAMQKFFA